MKAKALFLGVAIMTLLVFSCKEKQSKNRQRNQEPPSVEEIFEQMDEDENGLLTEKEVKGPLKEMFSKIDTNEDGFLSKKEIEKAPKPEGRKPKQ